MADAAATNAYVLNTVIVLHPPAVSTGRPHQPSPPAPMLPPALHAALQASMLTRRVTVGSLSALPMRWPSSVFVRRNRRRMWVALVKSRSRGE